MFGINVGSLVATIEADDSEFTKVIGQVERKMTRLSSSLSRIGSKMSIAITAPFVAMANVSVAAFSDFNKAMTEAAAVTQGASKDIVEQMGNVAKALSTETVFSAEELGKAYVALGRAGNTATQAMQRLPVVAKLAQAGVVDLEETVELLTTAFASLQDSAKSTATEIGDFTRLANLLLEASIISEGEVTDFALAITRKVGPALRFTNRDMTEGIALLATYAKMGMRGAFAAERVDILLRDLHKAQIKNAEAWRMMGLETENNVRGVIPLVEVLRKLESSMSGMLPVQKRAMLEQLGFQHRSVQATIAMIGMTDVLELFQDHLKQTSDSLNEVSQKQMEAFANKMKTVSNQLNLMAIDIGESLAPKLQVLADAADFISRAFQALHPAVQSLVIAMGGVLAVIGPVVLFMGTFVTMIRDTFSVLTRLNSSLSIMAEKQSLINAASVKLNSIRESEIASIKRHTLELERNAAAQEKSSAARQKDIFGRFSKDLAGQGQLFQIKADELVPSSTMQRVIDFEKVNRNAAGSLVVFAEKADVVGKTIVDQFGNTISMVIQGSETINESVSSVITPLESQSTAATKVATSVNEIVESWGKVGGGTDEIMGALNGVTQQLTLWDNQGRAAATTNQRLVNSLVPLGKTWNDLEGASEHLEVSAEALNAAQLKTSVSSRILTTAQTQLGVATNFVSAGFTRFVGWLTGATAAALTTTAAVAALRIAISSLLRATIILGLMAAAFELLFWAVSKVYKLVEPLITTLFGLESSEERLNRVMKEAGIETGEFANQVQLASTSTSQLTEDIKALEGAGGLHTKTMAALKAELAKTSDQIEKNRQSVSSLLKAQQDIANDPSSFTFFTGEMKEDKVKDLEKINAEIQRLIQENKNLIGTEEKKAKITAQQLEGAQKTAKVLLDLQDEISLADPTLSAAAKSAAEFEIELRKLGESGALPSQIEHWKTLKAQLKEFENQTEIKKLNEEAASSLQSLTRQVELADPSLSELEKTLLNLEHRWQDANAEFGGSNFMGQITDQFNILAEQAKKLEHDKLFNKMVDDQTKAMRELTDLQFPESAEQSADEATLQAFKDQIDALEKEGMVVAKLRSQYDDLARSMQKLREGKAIDKVTNEIESAFKSVRTPQEILDESLAQINEWKNQLGDKITPDIEEKLKRLSEKAFEEFKESADKNLNLKDSLQMPDALGAGSSAALRRMQDFLTTMNKGAEGTKLGIGQGAPKQSKTQELIEQARKNFTNGLGTGFNFNQFDQANRGAVIAGKMKGIDPHVEGANRVKAGMVGFNPHAAGAARVEEAMRNRPPIAQKPLPPMMQEAKDKKDIEENLQTQTNDRLDLIADLLRSNMGASF